MQVPENAWLKLSFCAISDSTGLTTAISVEGRLTLTEEFLSKCHTDVCNTMNAVFECDDARPMTAKEVKDYMNSMTEEDEFFSETHDGFKNLV